MERTIKGKESTMLLSANDFENIARSIRTTGGKIVTNEVDERLIARARRDGIISEESDGSSAEYYRLPPGAEELQDLISHRDMNAQMGEIFRSCYRYGIAKHSDKLRDAKKIRFYIEAEIKRLEAGK